MRALSPAAFLMLVVIASPAMAAWPPRDLNDAHRDLEYWLGPSGVQRVKSARSEEETMYHIISLPGTISLTNRWHLWENSPLAQYFKELGVTEPHDMVGVVTATYWCKVHGKPIRLREHAKYWREAEAKNSYR
jgi:hypothetical protein